MNLFEYSLEAAHERQARLRDLAARPPITLPRRSLRARLGHALVQVGVWLEGRQPETPLPTAGPRLAGIHR